MPLNGSTVRVLKDDREIEISFRLREKVFVDEQGVDRQEEFDGLDESAIHIGVFLDGTMIGCGRIRTISGSAKLERIAVHPDHRGRGIGKGLVEEMSRIATSLGVKRIYIHSQASAEGFYGKCGFMREGNGFMEAGIPHVMMARGIDALDRPEEV